jgi:hypothetical protein
VVAFPTIETICNLMDNNEEEFDFEEIEFHSLIRSQVVRKSGLIKLFRLFSGLPSPVHSTLCNQFFNYPVFQDSIRFR